MAKADVLDMLTVSTSMLVVLLIAGAITVISMLSVFANVIGHETQLHDLRNRVKDLQFQHAMYIAKINGQIPEPGQEERLGNGNTKMSVQSQTPETDRPMEAIELPMDDEQSPDPIEAQELEYAAAAA